MATATIEQDYVAFCVKRWEDNPELSIAQLFRELQDQPGFNKSYETVHRKVMALRPSVPVPATVKAARAKVAKATAVRQAIAVKAAAALAVQVEAVEQALAAGIGVTELARVTGLSISRIHQIRLAA
jgi:hypothetical protein